MTAAAMFEGRAAGKVVRVGVIGTGEYATAIVTQSRAIPRLEVPAAADLDLDAARRAYRLAGFAEDEIVVCEGVAAAQRALERGQRIILTDPALMMALPLDVIVESTGEAEAGARHALEAIENGKHVAMVNKEADVVVGPMLKHLAERAGVVYTAVDGDQHGLLMQLVGWARELGLEILCGGKARNGFVLFDESARTVSFNGQHKSLSADQARAFGRIPSEDAGALVKARTEILGAIGAVEAAAIELTIAANATGLVPDGDALHHPILRTVEIPEALCPAEEGGILRRRGVIDEVICLCGPDEAHLGGGVFVVVACANDYSRHILTSKGLLSNRHSTAALIYRPYHLCGVETPTSILQAGLLGIPTGALDYAPRFDVVARTRRALAAGERLRREDVRPLMRPARPVADGAPLPLGMACGNLLAQEVTAESVITADVIQRPLESVLWSLRSRQDERFQTG